MILQCMYIICRILKQLISTKEVVLPLQKENILERVYPIVLPHKYKQKSKEKKSTHQIIPTADGNSLSISTYDEPQNRNITYRKKYSFEI